MEMEEIVKVLIFVLVLAISIGAAVYFLGGGGEDLFGSIKNLLRFGK
ncbi:hypothetical protein HNV12_16935 [Methanococcoides sp. SA1]|nr:hypothetical protein [Methanococcoides sp. SA1]